MLEVRSVDSLGNIGFASITVIQDTYNQVAISSPANNATIYDNKTTVSGTTDPSSTVKIFQPRWGDTLSATANTSGNYSFSNVGINWGSNKLKVISTDPRGHAAACSITVYAKTNAAIAFTNKTGGSVLTYNAGTDSIYVTVTDRDENNDTTLVDSIPAKAMGLAKADSQDLFLHETGINTGVFRNLTGLATAIFDGIKVNNDGVLEVSEGEMLKTTYVDNDDATDSRYATIRIYDATPPNPPVNLTAVSKPSGKIELNWQAPAGEGVANYKIYKSDTLFSVRTGLTPIGTTNSLSYVNYPAAEGIYYWAVTALDSTGNESQISACQSARCDKTPPTALIAFSPSDTLGIGLATVTLSASEKLQAAPSLKYKSQYGTVWNTIALSGSDASYSGAFEITAQSGDGIACFSFSGLDSVGNAGSAIASGSQFVINALAPSAGISTTPGSPVTVGGITAQIAVSESLPAAPSLKLVSASGCALSLAISGRGRSWTGTAAIPDGFGDGIARYNFYGEDICRTAGTTIASGRELTVDATPTAPPDSFRGASRSGGRIELGWNAPSGEPIASYRLYRKTAPFVADENLDTISSQYGINGTNCTDVPASDGLYYYAIAARDAAGNRSQAAYAGPFISDRQGPDAPLGVAVRRGTGNIVQIKWSPAAGGATRYELYRATYPFGSPGSATLIAGNLNDTMATDYIAGSATYYYAAAAADSIGNTGPLSDRVAIKFDLVPPAAVISTRPASPVKAGTIIIQLRPSEPLADYPSLELVSGTGPAAILGLVDSAGCYWSDYLITPQTGDGSGFFNFSGTDSAGNAGTTISAGRQLVIDTKAPNQITQFTAEARPGGAVDLTWSAPEGELPAGYRIYRDTSSAAPDTAGVRIGQTNNCSYRDAPANDGIYYYRVAGYDAVGNESALSDPATARIDRSAPEPPSGFSADISLLPVALLSWDPAANDTLAYDLYRNGALIKSGVSGGAARDTLIFQGVFTYKLNAGDRAGNRSGWSDSIVVRYDTTRPTAVIALSPSSPVGMRGTTLRLIASEGLAALPTLTYTPYNASPLAVALTQSGTREWSAAIVPVLETPQGPARFHFSGVDLAGNAGTAITSGSAFYFDLAAPPAPRVNSCTSQKSGTVALGWSPVPEAVRYNVYRSLQQTV
ncbi:MAG: hypothetical protein QME74_06950, partial [Candidatus Edwardsbacteria bacterium]|nr:hypothetical protein [Candidatus Edwardsbacteria bacterium]